MAYDEFTGRLKRLGTSLGFSAVRMWKKEEMCPKDGAGPELKWADDREAVILLSCKVHYNPRWGGYGGHPQLLAREDATEAEDCPAAFLAPFLEQYRFAQEHIYLTETQDGRHLVTLPESLLNNDGGEPGRLVINIAGMVEPDTKGRIAPIEIAGSMLSYPLADELLQTLDGLNFAWKRGRSIPIGKFLASRLFTFIGLDREDLRSSIFGATLFPHLAEIVTHSTPNLRAAEIHLRGVFKQTIAGIAEKVDRRKVLCLAGLDIDMDGFMGQSERYFVPWKAFMAGGPEDSRRAGFVDQDDLFVKLMQ